MRAEGMLRVIRRPAAQEAFPAACASHRCNAQYEKGGKARPYFGMV